MKPLRSGLAPICILLAACVSHSVDTEPIEIKPIHITMDINLKVQRELDQFFDFEEEIDPAKPRTEASETPPGGATDRAPDKDSTTTSDSIPETGSTPSRNPR